MVEVVSLALGVGLVLGLVVFALSYAALYLAGQRSVSESSHYVNTRDVETYRSNSVRDAELRNTEASVQDERPVPEWGTNDSE